MGRERLEFAPVHAEFVNGRPAGEPRPRAKRGRRGEKRVVRASEKTASDRIEGRRLLPRRPRPQYAAAPFEQDVDGREHPDGALEIDPPQGCGPVQKSRRREHREGCLMPFERGQRLRERIAITVVERERDEGHAWFGRLEERDHLFERNDPISRLPDMRDEPVEKSRRDLEEPVGRERIVGRLGHAMEREDRAPAPCQRRREPVQACGAQDPQTGADHPVPQHAHAHPLASRNEASPC